MTIHVHTYIHIHFLTVDKILTPRSTTYTVDIGLDFSCLELVCLVIRPPKLSRLRSPVDPNRTRTVT